MNLGFLIKWAPKLGTALFIGYGIYAVYSYHLDKIEEAKNSTRLIIAAQAQDALYVREAELREESRLEKERIQVELDRAQKEVDNLRRMLLIEHDLDRLLQEKPGLILPRVNEGTEKVLKELEEITR